MDLLLQPWTWPCCHNEGSLSFEQNVNTTPQCKLLIYLCQMGGEKKVLIVICLNRQARKVQISLPGRKKCAAKKEAKKTSSSSVPEKNQDNLKRYYFFFKFFILFCFPCLHQPRDLLLTSSLSNFLSAAALLLVQRSPLWREKSQRPGKIRKRRRRWRSQRPQQKNW